MDDAAKSWHAVFVPLGCLLCDAHGAYFFVVGVVAPMLYLQPARTDRINKVVFWVHDLTKPVEAAPLLAFDTYKVVQTDIISPAHMFILNKNKPLDRWPANPVIQTHDRMLTIIEASASIAFKGSLKEDVKRLDREEVHAITSETSHPVVVLKMVMKVLKMSEQDAAKLLLQHRVFRVAPPAGAS